MLNEYQSYSKEMGVYEFAPGETARSQIVWNALKKFSANCWYIDPTKYDVYYRAGGWGAAFDLAQSDQLADLITEANANGKILSSVCHGALGLVNAKTDDGSPLIEGRNVTGVTDRQIKQLGITVTPKHPETEMRKEGANFEPQTAFVDMLATHVVVDGNIVTGQNQNSGYETSLRVLEVLAEKTK
jgi:putative intracellular protease/amidase